MYISTIPEIRLQSKTYYACMLYKKNKKKTLHTAPSIHTHGGNEDLEKVTDWVSATIMWSVNVEICCFQVHPRNSYLQIGQSLFRLVMHLSRKQNLEVHS